jgi:hypothetical protein
MSVFARSTSGPQRRRRRAVRLALVGVLTFFVVLVACTDQESSTGTTVVTTAPPTTIPATSNVGPTTSAPVVTTAPTTLATTSSTSSTSSTSTTGVTTEPCVAPTGTDEFVDGFPFRMSSLVGVDIRTGAHPCFERVVIELGGTGEMPGVRVGYVDDPVLLSPSDMTVEIAGDATLLVAVAAWMPDMEGNGWTGPSDIAPTNVEHILQLRQVENFEGMHQWAIGLDEERPFDVVFLDSPHRIVIDIATA